MSKSTKNQIIKAEYIPSASHDEIDTRSSFKLPVDDLSHLGSTFAIIASEIGRAIDDSHNSEGLYRCVFAEGVTGKLATFKDNPHYSRKLKVDLFIDDRNVGGLPDWGTIYQLITRNCTLEDYLADGQDASYNTTSTRGPWWKFW